MIRFFPKKNKDIPVFKSKGISLTIKVLVLTVLISACVWLFLDYTQSRTLRQLFVGELAKTLEIQAKENRLFFDQHVQSHQDAAQLILSQQRFQQYVSGEAWLSNEAMIHHQNIPQWLPSASVMRTFFNARYALLIDSEEQVREIYHYFPENPPPSLLTPGELLPKINHNQAYLTTIEGFPYVLALQSFENSTGQVVATLLLASPVDNEFLIAAMGRIRSKQLVSLLAGKRVIASSNPDVLPAGTMVDSLKTEYLKTDSSFLDCGTLEVAFHFASFVTIDKAHHLVNKILSKEHAQRAVLASVLVLSFVLLTLWMTWRLKRTLRHIMAFSKDSLGIEPRQAGDEMSIMQQVTLEMSGTMRRVLGEIQHTVSGAKHGNLTHRVDTRHLNGFMKELGESTNQLIMTTSEVIVDLTRVMSALAQGDLNTGTKDDYEGIYAEVSTFSRITISNIKNIVLEIQVVVDSASRGEWDKLISLSNKQGFSKELSQAVNTLVEIQKNFSFDLCIFLENLKNGDLTQPIQSEYQGEFNRIKQNANRTIETLISMLDQIKQIADAVNQAATDIEKGNQSLSHRTEAQAVFLEETVTSMEELTTTVEQNAQHAQTAHQLALSAAEVAGDGGIIVEEAVDTMQQVRDFSQQMLGVINIIKKIAFQTNMLALNAAVEAAHAGEHGRGFAVIAKDVRNLAQRSAEEAKEINTLIEESVSNIEMGTILVEQAKDSMHEIIASFQRVTDITSNISQANIEQSKGIKQINIAIARMDKMTQENAALVEQVAANATGLAEQAAKLTEAFGQFKGDW